MSRRLRNAFARCWPSQDEAREVYRAILDLSDVTDFAGAVMRSSGYGVLMSSTTGRLPSDFSFWRFDRSESPIFLSAGFPFSKPTLRRELERSGKRVSVSHWCDFNTFTVSFDRRGTGFQVQAGFSGDFTLQDTLRFMRKVSQLSVWNRTISVNWRYEGSLFLPCYIDVETGESVDSRFQCSNEHSAIECFEILRTLCDSPPRSIGRSEEVSPALYTQLRDKLDSESSEWLYMIYGTYADGVDPFRRPASVPPEGLQFPISKKIARFDTTSQRTDIQMTCVHLPDGSYIEFLSAFGPDTLREWTERFPNLKWEFWPGAESERWDGDPTPVEWPDIQPAPPLMYRTQMDYETPCFIDQRILTLFIDSGVIPTESHKWTSGALRMEREAAKYTREELAHLSKIDMIETKFEEIAARYTDWDNIRFWWPHKGEKAYWDKRPNLWGVKTLPMKIRGVVEQIPVEFVEPLKCPM